MQFRVVWDQLEACPYLPDRLARLPLRLPLAKLSPTQFDRALERGERRSGRMLYRTQCPDCTACEPLRVPVARFQPSASQRRVWRRNEGELRVELGPPELSWDRLVLYNRHKHERGLSRSDEPMSPQGYKLWLVDSCTRTEEVRYYDGDRLIAVSVLDFGAVGASSVYHYFDPDEARRSLGVYSVLKEIELCRALGLDWYYLGYFVRDCRHLAYKATYWPHQRFADGRWWEFAGPEAMGVEVPGAEAGPAPGGR